MPRRLSKRDVGNWFWSGNGHPSANALLLDHSSAVGGNDPEWTLLAISDHPYTLAHEDDELDSDPFGHGGSLG